MEEAKQYFERCGLGSYVDFCLGKLSLANLRNPSVNPDERISHLESAEAAFGRVSQRFDRQEEIIESYRRTLRAEMEVAGVEQTVVVGECRSTWAELMDGPTQLLGGVSQRFSTVVTKELNTLQKLFTDASQRNGTPSKEQVLQLCRSAYGSFRKLHRSMPDLEGYYLPIVSRLLGEYLTTSGEKERKRNG